MEQSIISAAAALGGSLVGGISTFAASWARHRTQTSIQQAARREELYAEFINEASRHLVSVWGNQIQSPESLVDIYAALERIRLISSAAVVSAAERVMQQVVSAYNAPNRTYDELLRIVMSDGVSTPLTDFTQACRAELSGARNSRKGCDASFEEAPGFPTPRCGATVSV